MGSRCRCGVGNPVEAPAVIRLLLLMDAKVNIARRLLATDLGLSEEKAQTSHSNQTTDRS